MFRQLFTARGSEILESVFGLGAAPLPGSTQLSFWYRCAARRVANGGLKNEYSLNVKRVKKRVNANSLEKE